MNRDYEVCLLFMPFGHICFIIFPLIDYEKIYMQNLSHSLWSDYNNAMYKITLSYVGVYIYLMK